MAAEASSHVEKAIRDHNYLMDYNLKRGLEQGFQQGLEQSIKAFIEMYQDDSYSREKTASRLARMLSLSPEAAEEYLKKYWNACPADTP